MDTDTFLSEREITAIIDFGRKLGTALASSNWPGVKQIEDHWQSAAIAFVELIEAVNAHDEG